MRQAGPMHRPWDEAWQDALYGDDGFYRRAAPAAHFATSVQGIPGAGELLAQAVARLAHDHACTRVVDLGCGRGELLTHLRQLDPDLHLTGVDVVERPEGLDVDAWLVSPGGPALPDDLRDLEDTLVLAHEWLDVVPCPVVEQDETGVWGSVTVTRDGTERPGSPLVGPDLDWVQTWVPAGVGRAEVGRPRDLALADLLGRVTRGVVVVVDYGYRRETWPAHGTLTGFRDGREVDPVPDGRCDLTAHVAVDSLLATARQPLGQARRGTEPTLTSQRDLLRELLGDPSTPVPHGLATTRPAAYLQAVARRGALGLLTAPGGLGDFHWLVVPRG